MRKRLYLFILICWLAGIFIFLCYPLLPVPQAIKKITFYDKAAHIVFFGVAMYLFLAIGIRWNKFRFFWTALFSFFIVTIINLFGEFIQGYIPGRTPEFLDFIAGVIGTAVVIPLAYMLHFLPKRKILLHVCCAPCATAVREILDSGYKLELYFFNPNIHPESEYQKRLKEVKKLARAFGLKLRVGQYDQAAWNKAIAGYEDEPEGGSRCEFCFRLRLRETAKAASQGNFPLFTTTLSVSPHKNTLQINRLGDRIGRWQGLEFLAEDFKKNGGFQRSLVLSKDFGFYRQKYCGCKYSMRAGKT